MDKLVYSKTKTISQRLHRYKHFTAIDFTRKIVVYWTLPHPLEQVGHLIVNRAECPEATELRDYLLRSENAVTKSAPPRGMMQSSREKVPQPSRTGHTI